MPTTFIPSDAIDMAKEKEWASGLGMLDWDDVNIVFTKRSLIEFLKYTGTTVDTNFANIHKLPRYAKIGSFSPPLSDADDSAGTTPAVTSPVVGRDPDAFKPTRRVRTAPGGPHTDIFGEDFQGEEDALSRAPPKHAVPAADTTPAVEDPKVEEEEEVGIQFSSNVKPSRRVRTEPGGKSSIGSLWDDDAPAEEFKPTRRVREGPGGQDNLSNLW